jgi:ComF family protein
MGLSQIWGSPIFYPSLASIQAKDYLPYIYCKKPALLSLLKQGLSHLFYPILCEGCNKPLVAGEEVLCMGCAMQMPETGFHLMSGNEAAQRLAGRVPFIHAVAFAHFTDDGLLQHLMHGLKYQHKKEIGTYLGKLLGQRLLETGWCLEIDLIIPVPLHPKKEAARGYNQSMAIAEGIAQLTGWQVSGDILLRARETESQVKKWRDERVKNMEGAFIIKNAYALKNKHILLCDDVLTTGATLEACALALMKEETIKISIATIGIAAS